MEAIATMTNTMIVVTVVSLRVGHVTFCASARTSCMNLNGLTFAITLSSGFLAQTKDETGRRFLLGIRFVAEVRHRAADDACYLLPVHRIVKRDPTPIGRSSPWRQSVSLNIGLANDAAILLLLLTYMCGKLRRGPADRLEPLQSPFWLELLGKHGGVAPLAQLIDHAGGGACRHKQTIPNADLVTGITGLGDGRHFGHPFEPRRRADGERAQVSSLDVLGRFRIVGHDRMDVAAE